MTEWERQRERDEFSRMRRVYQPLSVSLSRRFTKETDGETKIEKVHSLEIWDVLIWSRSHSCSPRNRIQSRLLERTCLVS